MGWWDRRFILTTHFHITKCYVCMLNHFSRAQLFVTLWTIAHQAPPSMGFSRQEYWSGLPFPSPGDLPNPGIEPRSPTLQADALTSAPPGKPLEMRIGEIKWLLPFTWYLLGLCLPLPLLCQFGSVLHSSLSSFFIPLLPSFFPSLLMVIFLP